MAVLLTRIFSALHLENDDFVTLYKWIHNFYYYFGTINSGCSDSHCSFIVNKKHFVKLNSFAGFHILDVMDKELFALLNLKLLTVNFYNCVAEDL